MTYLTNVKSRSCPQGDRRGVTSTTTCPHDGWTGYETATRLTVASLVPFFFFTLAGVGFPRTASAAHPRIYLSRSMELNDDGQWPEQDEHATYQISGSRTPHAQQPRGCNHPAHAKGAVTSGGLILQQLP